MNNNGDLQVLEQSLGLQVKQAQALHELIIRFNNQEERINGKIERVEDLMEDLSKQITINYEEQKEIQSLVAHKASTLTKEHLDDEVSDNLFKAWKGLFIRRIYSRIKEQMNVVRYTAVKREDFDIVLNYLESLTYSDFKLRELQPTPTILNIMELEIKA